MPDAPCEYLVSIRWSGRHNRSKKGYVVVARNREDALAFARYKFFKRHHPAISTIDEITILEERP